jgi:hypothetical protein
LGAKIGIVAASFGLTLYLVFFGYKIANSGFNALDGGQKVRGVLMFCGGILLACGCALFLP